jgi:Protein of unknown function (DUF664)
VSSVVAPAAPADRWTTELRGRLDELPEEYRSTLHDCLDGLSEDEARLQLQVLRELAQHAGHADILREQVLARRANREET